MTMMIDVDCDDEDDDDDVDNYDDVVWLSTSNF